MKTTEMRIQDIVVGRRQRKDLGDLAGLARSIKELGFLQPLAITTDRRLLGGQRRLEAAKLLGRATVPVHVCDGLDDALMALRAEQAENCERKPFTPSEMVQVGRELELLLAADARRRQRAGKSADGRAGGRGRRKENPPESFRKVSGPTGETRDRVGEALGWSGKTYTQARAVVEAAEEEPERFGPLRDAMDAGGRVSGCWRRLQVAKQADAIAAEPPPLPTGPFRVVVIDPPWEFHSRCGDVTKRGLVTYPTMATAEIAALPVGKLADPRGAVVFLWVTNSHLPDGFRVLEAWGATYKVALTWVKNRPGCGDYLRGMTEHALLATVGRPTLDLSGPGKTTALHAPAADHSTKPQAFFDLVESLVPSPPGGRLELFARKPRPGWVCWGGSLPPAEAQADAAANGHSDGPRRKTKATRPAPSRAARS